jgi:hypothetical protein
MGKNKSASNLVNVIDFNNDRIAFISGSTTLMSISSSGAITVTGVISGSNAASASYALNAGLLNNRNSAEFTSTGSFNSYTSSNDATVTSVAGAAVSAVAGVNALAARTSSYTTTSSFNSYTASNNTTMSCVFSTATSALVGVGALAAQTGSYSTTGSNTFVGGAYFSSSFNPTGFSTTASLYTDGGLRVTRDAYISGTLYLNNVTVFGTQSVAYISSSQLNIGTNLITVNTDTPSIRFGGLAVYDSGSTGLTGSILWDSQNNHWIYSNPSGSSYSGGMFISGPRASSLGTEQGTTSCMLLAGQGGDHLTSSMIYHSSTVTCFYGNSTITSAGAATFNSCVTANGRVTINNGSNDALYIQDASSNFSALAFRITGGVAFISSTMNAGSYLPLSLYTSDTERVRITTTGIATFACQICTTALVTADSRYTGTGYITYDTANTGTECLIIRKDGTSVLTFNSNSSATFACQVCVPRLQVFNTNSIVVIEGTATNGEGTLTIAGKNSSGTSRSAIFKYDNADIIRVATADAIPMRFETSDVTRMTILSTGISCFSCQVCANAGLISNTLSIACNSGDDRAMYMSLNCSANYNSGAANTIARSVNSLKFLWYNNCWEIGATRGDDTAIQALVFAKNGNTYLAMTCHGIANFACQVCMPATAVISGGGNTLTLRKGTGTPAIAFAGTSDEAAFLVEGMSGGGMKWYTSPAGCTLSNAAWNAKFNMDVNGISTFSCTVCAASLITNAGGLTENFNATGGGHINRYFAVKYMPENATTSFFRISTSGASVTHVHLAATNAGVGWYSSQVFHSGISAYWGGWVGSGTQISRVAGEAGYINGVHTDGSGNQTYCVIVANNGTSTSSLVFAYITTITYGGYSTTFTQL